MVLALVLKLAQIRELVNLVKLCHVPCFYTTDQMLEFSNDKQ